MKLALFLKVGGELEKRMFTYASCTAIGFGGVCSPVSQEIITEALISILHTRNRVSKITALRHAGLDGKTLVIHLLVAHSSSIVIVVKPATFVCPSGLQTACGSSDHRGSCHSSRTGDGLCS
jgi:hypothetical protein